HLDPVPGRMAVAVPVPALHLDTRPALAVREDRLRAVRILVGTRDVPALPVRSAHAARLEGFSTVFAVLAGLCRGRARRLRLGAGHSRQPCMSEGEGKDGAL